MPRYLVERSFPDGWQIAADESGVVECARIVDRNADDGVTWVQSYVSEDKTKAFCVYDAPGPEAIRRTARRNALPIDRITHVVVLDPYFYR
jgi:hypothetical protein